LLSIGGGITTDVGGMLAALYRRGIASVFVPTTMVGMVDASLGGKNGVHLGPEKNALGTIRQPLAVIADPRWLDTLSETRLHEGLVECLKVAAISDVETFDWLETQWSEITRGDASVMGTLVARALTLKARIVSADARDRGQRRWLNFGHTVGHAIESTTDFALSHGRAVAMGLLVESAIRPFPGRDRLARSLARLSFEMALPEGVHAGDLWEAMRRDKKARRDGVVVAVPRLIGEGEVIAITRQDFVRALAQSLLRA